MTYRIGMDAVAPHAGAWIETINHISVNTVRHVAPHAGAWIETFVVNPVRTSLLVVPQTGAPGALRARQTEKFVCDEKKRKKGEKNGKKDLKNGISDISVQYR